MSNLKGILFDLDGTVLDTRELIYRSFEHVIEVFWLHGIDRKELIKCWGEPLATTMQRWSPENYEELLSSYREYMYDRHDELVKPFDGMEEVLSELQTEMVPVALVTSKVRRGAERGLKQTGLEKYFQVVVTVEDTGRAKPHADPALLAAEKLFLKPEDLMFAGDTVHDIYCAKHAGCVSIAVDWSECSRENLAAAEPDYFAAEPKDLLRLYRKLSRR